MYSVCCQLKGEGLFAIHKEVLSLTITVKWYIYTRMHFKMGLNLRSMCSAYSWNGILLSLTKYKISWLHTYYSLLDPSDILNSSHVTLSRYGESTVPSTTEMSFSSGHLITDQVPVRSHRSEELVYVEKRIRARKSKIPALWKWRKAYGLLQFTLTAFDSHKTQIRQCLQQDPMTHKTEPQNVKSCSCLCYSLPVCSRQFFLLKYEDIWRLSFRYVVIRKLYDSLILVQTLE